MIIDLYTKSELILFVRDIFGDDLLIINLKMSQQDKHARLMERHDDNEAMVAALENFDKTLEKNGVFDEDISTVDLIIENNPSKQEVAKMILTLIESAAGSN